MYTDCFYRNPVLTGFHPDPSLIRVDDDYYLVNSTFHYFPAIVISHSRDLVNWEIVGHAVERNDYLDLRKFNDSYGLWAPDISYHNGVYYIFATLRLNGPTDIDGMSRMRRQLVVTARKPEGPYSKPVFIDVDGIDPSHFVDDDGTHYMVLSPGISIVKLNDECTQALGDKTTIWAGTGRRAPEGPHLFKKDDYYYAVLAEGGTGYGHCVTIARSRSLYGPYEPCPFNPILHQGNPDGPIQKTGHGKVVQTQNGDWWMVYLCGRPNDGNYCTLGRETALDPVQWTHDGWFMVNNLEGPSTRQVAPMLPEHTFVEQFRDDFESGTLKKSWQFVRNPDVDSLSLTERPGYMRIWTVDGDLDSIDAKNVMVRREKHHRYSAVVKMEFYPENGEQAGLTCYYSTNTFVKFFLTYREGLKRKLVQNRGGLIECVAEQKCSDAGEIYLRVSVNKQVRNFDYSYNNEDWHHVGTVGDARFLSDEGIKENKRFTATMVGMFANDGGIGLRLPADFDWFDYMPEEDD